MLKLSGESNAKFTKYKYKKGRLTDHPVIYFIRCLSGRILIQSISVNYLKDSSRELGFIGNVLFINE